MEKTKCRILIILFILLTLIVPVISVKAYTTIGSNYSSDGSLYLHGGQDVLQFEIWGSANQSANIMEIESIKTGDRAFTVGSYGTTSLGSYEPTEGTLLNIRKDSVTAANATGLSQHIVKTGADTTPTYGGGFAAVAGTDTGVTMSSLYALTGNARSQNVANVTNSYSVYAYMQHLTSGTVANQYYLYAGNGSVGGNTTIGTTYGLYVENMTRGSTADYGIYVAGADTKALWIDSGESRFDGNVRVGQGTRTDGLVIAPAGEVTTTNADETTVTTFVLEDENTYQIDAYIVGVQSDGANRASYHLTATAYRTGAGVAVIQGQSAVSSAESNAAWNAAFTAGGNSVNVGVLGAADKTIRWTATLQYLNLSN